MIMCPIRIIYLNCGLVFYQLLNKITPKSIEKGGQLLLLLLIRINRSMHINTVCKGEKKSDIKHLPASTSHFAYLSYIIHVKAR